MKNLGVRFGFVQRSKNQSAQNRASYQRYRFVQRGVEIKTYSHPNERRIHSSLLLPINAPKWATDEKMLWERVSEAETRRDSVEARTLDVSLPRGLPTEASIEAMRALAQWFANFGICVQLDIHDCPALDGLQNPHAHFLIGTRALGPKGFSAEKSQRLEFCFRQERGRWIRRHIASIVNEFAFRAVGHKLVQVGPKQLELRPEPRLPRWAVKTEFGKEFLRDRRQIALVDEFKTKEAGIQKAIDVLTDEIGDLDWWISGFLGQLPTSKQIIKRSLEPLTSQESLSGENSFSFSDQLLGADNPDAFVDLQSDSEIELDHDTNLRNENDSDFDEHDPEYDAIDDYGPEIDEPDPY